MITLQKITSKNVGTVYLMKADENLVAPNNWSIAEAFAYRNEYNQDPIAYAICHDDQPVGFIMALYHPPKEFIDCIDNNDEPFYFLWRNMIDEQHQGKGYGRKALELLIEEARLGKHGKATAFYTATVRESGVTPKFYGSFGFEYTGELDIDENYPDEAEDVMRLAL